MGTMLMVGAGVFLLCQFVSMIMVLRATSERPDLVGLGRIMPVVISLIPIAGPFIAGRATGAGIRPVFPSLIGTLVLIGTFVVSPKGAPARPQVQAKAPAEGQAAEGAAEGQPAEDAASGQPAEGGAEAQPTADAATAPPAEPPAEDAASPEAVPTPAPTAEQPPAEQPVAPNPEATPPTDTPAAEAPPAPGPLISTAPTDEGTLDAEVGTLASVPVRPLIGTRQVLAETQLRIPGQHGLQSEYEYVFDGPTAKGLRFARLQIGISVTRPPRSSGPRQLYIGGRLLSYDNRVIDRFYPYSVSSNVLEVGRRFPPMRTLRGYYEAEFRVAELKLTDDGQVEAAAFDVRIR